MRSFILADFINCVLVEYLSVVILIETSTQTIPRIIYDSVDALFEFMIIHQFLNKKSVLSRSR